MSVFKATPEALALGVFALLFFKEYDGRRLGLAIARWWCDHVPAGARRIATVTAAAVAVGVQASYSPHGWVRIHVALGLLLLQVVATGAPLVDQWRLEQLQVDADKLVTEAEANRTKVFNRALAPLCDRAKAVADTWNRTTKEGRRPPQQAAVSAAVLAGATLLGGPDVRATFFTKSGPPGRRRLDSRGNSQGRADRTDTIFDETTPRGRRIFDELDKNQIVHVNDILLDPPAEYPRRTRPPIWRSFLSIPVRTSRGQVLGMLTVDSPRAGEFKAEYESEGTTAILVADLFAVVLSA